jgi:hypothetical protein
MLGGKLRTVGPQRTACIRAVLYFFAFINKSGLNAALLAD